ncbi:hypothetical protein Tdes44962_MAKER10416 [Teratosphaeria destructans]|uniref:NTF2-like domain-containing protein n=1 Tax=Teratosphaeria destructans TaxID=418781 RepID=A0A9W7SII8_9PEZI|nr:hypothetical protein Tdes44962_MAKER10416 [Teratosphaeria destructans]
MNPQHLTAILSLALAASAQWSYDPANNDHPKPSRPCLTDAETTHLVAQFSRIASSAPNASAVANETLTPDFQSISDSVNFVDGAPLNTTLTHSRAQLLQQEAELPAVGTIKDLFISHSCDTITWYWEFATTPLPTRGIAILFVDGESRRIYKAYREVNSAVVLWNLGRPECEADFTVPAVGDQGPAFERDGCGGCLGG